jgi:glycosyltransferase involved in cell wall biosynthesis
VIDVAAFTGGWNVPSAKFRVRQYIEPLGRNGIRVREHAAALGVYPPAATLLRPFWAAGTLASRMPSILGGRRADLTLLQREMLSTFVTLEPLTRSPRVLDVDDAIWMGREGRAARRLAEISDLVICGNAYIAEHFAAWTSRTALLPTAVDTDRYTPLWRPGVGTEGNPGAEAPGPRGEGVPGPRDPGEGPVIGWMGTSSNFPYLERIEAALAAALRARPAASVLIVSDRAPTLAALPAGRWRFSPWSADREVADLQAMTIGLMPLDDTPWARGKCSFKMLTYMACGVPVVVSPVGMNVDVLAEGAVGLPATTSSEWTESLVSLLDAERERRTMGEAGRRVADARYSVRVVAPRLAALLTGAARA